MAVYYAKLTEIFWVSESHLYHAYAWYKLYVLQKSYNKNLTQKDLQLMASSVLLAALSVAPYDHKHGAAHFELENEKERNFRMASLLSFSLDPKRDSREVVIFPPFSLFFGFSAVYFVRFALHLVVTFSFVFEQLSRSALLSELVSASVTSIFDHHIFCYSKLESLILLLDYEDQNSHDMIILL